MLWIRDKTIIQYIAYCNGYYVYNTIAIILLKENIVTLHIAIYCYTYVHYKICTYVHIAMILVLKLLIFNH